MSLHLSRKTAGKRRAKLGQGKQKDRWQTAFISGPSPQLQLAPLRQTPWSCVVHRISVPLRLRACTIESLPAAPVRFHPVSSRFTSYQLCEHEGFLFQLTIPSDCSSSTTFLSSPQLCPLVFFGGLRLRLKQCLREICCPYRIPESDSRPLHGVVNARQYSTRLPVRKCYRSKNVIVLAKNSNRRSLAPPPPGPLSWLVIRFPLTTNRRRVWLPFSSIPSPCRWPTLFPSQLSSSPSLPIFPSQLSSSPSLPIFVRSPCSYNLVYFSFSFSLSLSLSLSHTHYRTPPVPYENSDPAPLRLREFRPRASSITRIGTPRLFDYENSDPTPLRLRKLGPHASSVTVI